MRNARTCVASPPQRQVTATPRGALKFAIVARNRRRAGEVRASRRTGRRSLGPRRHCRPGLFDPPRENWLNKPDDYSPPRVARARAALPDPLARPVSWPSDPCRHSPAGR